MTFRIFPAVLGLLLIATSGAMAGEYDPLRRDPRFEWDPDIHRDLIERPILEPYRWPPGGGRPQRCSIRREVVADYLPGYSDRRFEEPVAPLRECEFGFERTGDPATSGRIDAFMRFRFERLSDGKPLRVERPKIDFDGGWGTSSDWPATPIDTEGFSGARIDIDDMDEAEFQHFLRTITAGSRIAVTLPEMGQDRVYWFAIETTVAGMKSLEILGEKLADCMCAFGNADISWALRDQCAQK
ncbi:MAG: hypothetical protein HY059_00970 [Proteobacteria bacterium]|nr:hypothetical protein [Pseudomonadota bacterium]